MISRRNLMNMQKKQVILVDHNEKAQAVDGIEEADILEIIDHHRLGSLETVSPVYFRNQPLGCTSTIIYQMYRENNIKIDKKTAGLLCSAIISDTLLFRSPTCTAVDRAAAEKLLIHKNTLTYRLNKIYDILDISGLNSVRRMIMLRLLLKAVDRHRTENEQNEKA